MDPLEAIESAAAPSLAAMTRAAMPMRSEPEPDPVAAEEVVAEAAEVVGLQVEVVEPVVAPTLTERATFEGRLKSRGYNIEDDIDPETLYDQAIERLTQGSAAIAQVEQLQAELQALRSSQAQAQSPAPAAAQSVAQEVAQQPVSNRLFKELKKFDPGLEQFVTFDAKGQATAKPDLGVQAIDAARAINEFYTQESEQIQRLVRNPHALFQDYQAEMKALAEQESKAYIDQRLAAIEAERVTSEAARESTRLEQAQYERENQWHNANKQTIFKLDTNGVPMKQPFDNTQPALTAVGAVFMNKYWELQAKAPSVDQFVLMDIALEFANATAPKPAAATPTPAQVAPVVAPVTPAVARRQFINQRVAIPNQNTPSASLHELTTDQPQKLRFADMVRNNPDVSEIVNNW